MFDLKIFRPTVLRHTIAVLLTFVAAIASVQVFASPLQPYTAEYEVLRNGEPLGRGTVSLKRIEGGTWELLSITRGTEGLAGLAGAEIVERSTLQGFDDRIETLAYHFRQDIAWKSRERSVSFDPAGKRILSRDRDREYPFAFARGVLDRQCVVLALAQDVAAGKRGVLSYTVVDRDQFGPQRYRVRRAEERVETPAGILRALRVERVRSESRGRTTTSWLGIEQGFLPVKVLQSEPDGDSFEMRLISLRR